MTDIGPSYVRSDDDNSYLSPLNIAVIVIAIVAVALSIAAIVVASIPPPIPPVVYPPPPPVPSTVTINILNIGNLFQLTGSSLDSSDTDMLYAIARFTTFVREVRPDVITFSGDIFTPSAMTTMFGEPKHIIKLLNMLWLYAPIVAVPGDHEFGLDSVNATSYNAIKTLFPWVLSNFYLPGMNKTLVGFRSALVKELPINYYKLGFFGLGYDYRTTTLIGHEADYIDFISSAKEVVDDLKYTGVDYIIALTHLSIEQQKQLMANVTGIDLCLGGQDYTTQSFDINGKPIIINTAPNLQSVSHITLTSPRNVESKSNISVKFVNTDISHYPEDPTMVEYIKLCLEEFQLESQAVLGSTATELKNGYETLRRVESNTGNYIADSVRNYAVEFLKLQELTDLPVFAVVNTATISQDKEWSKNISSGSNITKGMVYDLLPYGNTIAILKTNYTTLIQVLENAVSQLPSAEGRFLQISGFKFSHKCYIEWPTGGYCPSVQNRVSNATFYNNTELPIDGDFYLATTNLVAAGESGYSMLSSASIVLNSTSSDSLFTIVFKAIKTQSPISPQVEGRIVSANHTEYPTPQSEPASEQQPAPSVIEQTPQPAPSVTEQIPQPAPSVTAPQPATNKHHNQHPVSQNRYHNQLLVSQNKHHNQHPVSQNRRHNQYLVSQNKYHNQHPVSLNKYPYLPLLSHKKRRNRHLNRHRRLTPSLLTMGNRIFDTLNKGGKGIEVGKLVVCVK
eukprot:TRINITY_DN195_c0_g1_i3.p1 TRINITY_DN195_c0_g1~~TRINITY_DN195_c0_g1_i3.p1  ORF type:complete len:753 (+),score=112.02 TRINITY_DN195_c0_g1_i3:54-2261(+)